MNAPAPLPLVLAPLEPELDVMLIELARATGLSPEAVARACVTDRMRVLLKRVKADLAAKGGTNA